MSNQVRGELIFMARPSAAVIDLIAARLAVHGLDQAAGNALSRPVNWHQSLSDKHGHGQREAMLRAGARVRASAFELVLNRIDGSSAGGSDPIHWTLRARGGKPQGLVDLLATIRKSLALEGIRDDLGHTAHITLCYRAPNPLPETLFIDPVAWTIDTLELVVAGGSPYGYTTLERWLLESPAQSALF